MDLEQCVDMIKELASVYSQMAITSKISTNKVNKLKNILTEIEIYMVSIRKSVDQIKIKNKT